MEIYICKSEENVPAEELVHRFSTRPVQFAYWYLVVVKSEFAVLSQLYNRPSFEHDPANAVDVTRPCGRESSGVYICKSVVNYIQHGKLHM
jgi:hypothetical protein